jgi:hypothetical protein
MSKAQCELPKAQVLAQANIQIIQRKNNAVMMNAAQQQPPAAAWQTLSAALHKTCADLRDVWQFRHLPLATGKIRIRLRTSRKFIVQPTPIRVGGNSR